MEKMLNFVMLKCKWYICILTAVFWRVDMVVNLEEGSSSLFILFVFKVSPNILSFPGVLCTACTISE